MAIFQNTKIFFHFHVNYREAWNGNVNYGDLLFLDVFSSREMCEGADLTAPPKGVKFVSRFLSNLD